MIISGERERGMYCKAGHTLPSQAGIMQSRREPVSLPSSLQQQGQRERGGCRDGTAQKTPTSLSLATFLQRGEINFSPFFFSIWSTVLRGREERVLRWSNTPFQGKQHSPFPNCVRTCRREPVALSSALEALMGAGSFPGSCSDSMDQLVMALGLAAVRGPHFE